MKKEKFILFIGLMICLMACSKDEKTIDKSSSEFYTKKLNESCSKYKNVDIKSSNDIILDFFEYKNLIIYGGVNSISVYDLNSKKLVDNFQENELELRKIDIINDKVVVCTQKGMFEVSPTGIIKKVSNDACFDFIKFNNQYLYVSYVGTIDINNRDLTNIKILNTENYTFTLYLDPNYTDKNIFLMKLTEYKGKLFALASLDNKINIIEIENKIPIKILNKENDPGLRSMEYNMTLSDIHPFILNDEFFLLANPNSLAKYLLKYENGGFKQEMIWEDGYRSDDYKFKQFNSSHFNKVIQHDKKVNINTNVGLITFMYCP